MESGLPPQGYRGALRRLNSGLWIVTGVSAIISILMLTGAIYMLQIYDRVLNSGSVPTLLVLFGLVVVLYCFLAAYDGLRMRLLSRMALGLDAELAAAAFHTDLRLSERGERPHCTADLEILRSTLAGPSTLALLDLPFTFVFVTVLFAIHPILGWLTVSGMVLAGMLAFLNRMMLAGPISEAEPIEGRQRLLEEAVRATAPSLGALGMRDALCSHWLNAQRERLAVAQRGQEPSATLAAISRAFRMLLQAILLSAAAFLVLQGTITAGAIIAASILSGRAIAPVDQLIGQWQNLMGAHAAHKRLKQMLPAQPLKRLNLPPITGALSLEKVTYIPSAAATKDPLPILKDISFDLQPGAGLGIVGASASGKSTLAQLIVGALEPASGHIRIDGATLSQWGDDRLGRQIGYLPQRIDLLPGTVRDNICRFDQQATDATVLEAAKAANVHDMILRLPEGYDTVLGGAHMPLSGGQIQRIGLARALYGRPMLLVLDEPNAHLDRAGEMALTAALKARRAAGATVIVLAHRIGALAALDRLILLEEGEIREDGPRDAIISKLGLHAPKRSPFAPHRISIRALESKEANTPSTASSDTQLPKHDTGKLRPSIRPQNRQKTW
ncbi:MAG: type I secretion system permease/ATPase [Roseinatronobacter sp.]